jgi:phosphoglycerate dehydrogenase-like enzyme
MPAPLLPPEADLTIGFAHVAYQLGQEFATRGSSARAFEVRRLDELRAHVAEADVLVISGLWCNELVKSAPRLRFIQSISAGTDQFDLSLLLSRGIRLASAQGANERAVAEHAMALILALVRQLPQARDNQAKSFWRGMIADRTRREDELGGKLLLIVGLGRIGSRLAHLAKAFDMRVIGLRRSSAANDSAADSVLGMDHFGEALGQADVLALTCPLTPETRGLIGAEALARCKPGTLLINVARGPVVDEPALVQALQAGRLAGAGLDCFTEEPLPPTSALWRMEQVLITPHTAGETRRYEANVVDLLLDNVGRLHRGEANLRNGVV